MDRELQSFPFAPGDKMKLQTSGFYEAADIINLKPSELSRESGVTMESSLEIINLVKSETDKVTGRANKSRASHKNTALEMLRDEQSQQSIITFSQRLDDLLGGGVPLTKVTEFCGAPGIGKTQIWCSMCSSIQLSVDVQIPHCFGGAQGQSVYIDTEGSFIIDRVVDIAKATVIHCQQIASVEQHSEQLEAMKSFNFEDLLKGIHYFRCHDYTELIALVHTMPDFIKQHPQVKLVVVDSIAFHFRHDFHDYALRTRLLNGLAQSFVKMAALNKLAVVLTNQMTTKLSEERGEAAHLIPALGESWGHASTIRLILYWKNKRRHAMLYKSPSKREATVPYQITTGGIRDLSEHTTAELTQQPAKRQRLE